MAAEAEIDAYFQKAGQVVSTVYRHVMQGGEIQAAFRQGADEIGVALKAFPDSIQVSEPGAVLSPLYSDIAADKRAALYGTDALSTDGAEVPSPSQIAEANGSIYGESPQAETHMPSPGDIADQAHTSMQPEQNHDIGFDRGGRGMS
jgi:hypothetical protein